MKRVKEKDLQLKNNFEKLNSVSAELIETYKKIDGLNIELKKKDGKINE